MKTSYQQQPKAEFGSERNPETITFRLKTGRVPETDYLQIKLCLKSEGTVTIDLTPEETERVRRHWLKQRERRQREYHHLMKSVVEIVEMLTIK